MNEKQYTPDQIAFAEKMFDLLASVPEDKRDSLLAATEAFVSGTIAAQGG